MKKKIVAFVLCLSILMSIAVPGTLAANATSDPDASQTEIDATTPTEPDEPAAEPAAEEPAADEPAEGAEEPTAEEPAEGAEEPTAEEPAEGAEEPTAEEPAEGAEEPTAEEPAEGAEEPTAEEPAEGAEEPTAEEPAEGAEEPTAEEPAVVQMELSAQADGMTFKVSGELPEGTTLEVAALEETVYDYIRSNILSLDELPEGYAGIAYDIKLMNNGTEIEPDETVTVKVQTSGITAETDVQVYHLPNTSADDIYAAYQKDVMGIALMDLRDDGGEISGKQIQNVEVGEGYFKFRTDGFSVYYIAAGDMSDNNKEKRGQIANNTNDTYYTMPGTTLYFYVNTNWTVTWTATLPNGITGASNNIRYENYPAYRITIPEDFVPDADGTSFTLKAGWGFFGSNSGQVTVVVLSQQEFISKILTDPGNNDNTLDEQDEYPVYVAVLQNSQNSTGIPAEPGQSGAGYNFIEDGYSTGTDRSDVFHGPNGNGIINPAIGSHADLQGSVDGTNTVGLVDPTGVKTKAMLTGINWEEVKKTIFDIDESRYDTDGDVVDKSQPNDYEVIPYVIKLETTNDMQGWHIDCAIRKKTSVTLTYDNNIPSGMQLNTSIQLPNNVTTKQGNTVTVRAITGMDDETVVVSVITDPDEKYTFTFQGWNTKPDGTGDWYYPNGEITIEEDTILYAIWNSNPALGTGDLQIRKTVVAAEGDSVNENELFGFTVTISNAPEGAAYHYTTYNANDVAVSGGTGTITSGDTVSLKHSQYVIIEDLPAVNDENREPNITITETAVNGYTASWSNSATPNASTTVKIEGGRRSEVTCTNTKAPSIADLTIKKTGDISAYDENQSFIFRVTGPDGFSLDVVINGTGSVTIKDLPIGTYTVTEITDWSWRYTPEKNGQEITLTANKANTVTFNNTRTDTYWLSGDSVKENQFTVKSKSEED